MLVQTDISVLISLFRGEGEEDTTTTTVDLPGKGERVNQKTQFLRYRKDYTDNYWIFTINLQKNDVTPKTENPSQNNPISKLFEFSKKRK